MTETFVKTDVAKKGDRVEVTELRGYKLVQHRPFECRVGCVCGECNGKTVAFPGTARGRIYFADNSVELVVDCDDGRERRVMLEAPKGDVC